MAAFFFTKMLIWLHFIESFSHASQSDIDCLRGIHSSLEDPKGHLSTWNFRNTTKGFICNFTGVECWKADEDRVVNIRLRGMELKGTFPVGFGGCSSIQGLDLSNNKIHGSIPSDIDHLVSYLTSLDLSSNQLSGQIPAGLANFTYLNVIKLDNNQLTGQIPPEIGLLLRVREFSVANNRLSGPVPSFQNASGVTAESYANNAGLCGDPLPPCRGGSSKKSKIGAIAAAAVGGSALGFSMGFFCYRRMVGSEKNIHMTLRS